MRQRSDGTVTLSLFAHNDAHALCNGDRDPEHRRRFEFPGDFIPSLKHSENAIARWEQERLAGKRFPFAVRDTATDELLGGCELKPLDDEVANLSYWTYAAHRRRGVAARAIALACAIAFEDMGFRRLEVVTDPDNVGSRRAAVRNGFKEVGMREGRILHVVEVDEYHKRVSA
ncbi:MAG: GNAT family N-acetyltransferase [Acidobacteriia bacterium]|nr:GNAT family N-acetyltransferase [Terriglobia bacterium]